jgi:putative transposase
LRDIMVARPDHDQPLYLLTNDLQRPAVEIAQLYKERRDIELLFKWLKQNLKIRSFLGRSQNAVRIQIYVALIAFMLLRILHHTAARACKDSTVLLLTHIKFSLFNVFSLCQNKSPLPKPPALRPRNPQPRFAFQ